MESLNNLASSLPTSNLANAEKDVLNNFKSAALSITTLYKSSLRTSKRAYHAGYSAACQDLLLMIQQGVSAGESSDGNGMTIGRIMDYIEARLEAIKSREEEEDEDEEKDKERDRERRLPPSALSKVPSGTALNVKSSSATNHPPAKSRESVVSAPMTPLSPPPSTAGPAPPASPSPPSQATMRLPFPQSFMPGQRNSKSRLFTISSVNQKEAAMSSSTVPGGLLSAPADAPLAIIPPPSTPMMSHFSSYPSPESTGTKRRHAAISSDSSSSTSPPTASGSARRRTRSSRLVTSGATQDQNHAQPTDAMDVEEEGGRERKRVARR